MFISSGSVIKNVIKITWIDLAALISLNTLIIRKVRKMLVDVPSELIKPKKSSIAVVVDKISNAKSN
jgi:hypothetical protein